MGKFKRILAIIFNTNDGNIPVSYEASKRELEDNYIFDLKGTYWGGGMVEAQGESPTGGIYKEPVKIAVKPIDVLNEIKEAPKKLDLANLDSKIFMLNQKLELLKDNNYSKAEIKGILSCLENRKNYNHTFFSQFEITTLGTIDKLLEKYNLVMKSADLFIVEFPEEAIKIMKQYSAEVKKATKKKAVYYVIATSENFKSVEKKRDPILLAQSPFGLYYDILGAWDKEMLILSEL